MNRKEATFISNTILLYLAALSLLCASDFTYIFLTIYKYYRLSDNICNKLVIELLLLTSNYYYQLSILLLNY